MVQAAPSGMQDIAEDRQASGTSKKAELKLTNEARASQEELRLDYADYLRLRSLPRRLHKKTCLLSQGPARASTDAGSDLNRGMLRGMRGACPRGKRYRPDGW